MHVVISHPYPCIALEVIVDKCQLLRNLKALAYTAYRKEKRASGLFIILSTVTEELIFQLNETLSKEMEAELEGQLILYTKRDNLDNTPLMPDFSYNSIFQRDTSS